MWSLLFIVLVVLVFVYRRRTRRPSAALYTKGGPRIELARPKDPPPEPERWLLAANAIYSVWMERPVDVLLDLPGRPTYAEGFKPWEISTRDRLLFNLADLAHHGSRRPMRLLQQQDPALPQHDLLAFDLGRFLYLCVGGTSLGLITPEEGRVLMLHAGHTLQRHYAGWNDYADAFLAGYIINRTHKNIAFTPQSQARHDSLQRAIDLLKRSKQSPWQQLAWTAPLPRPEPDDFFDFVSRSELSEAIIYTDEEAFVPSDRNWTLAMGAVYRAWWGEPLDVLISNPAERLAGLKRDWGAENREETLDILGWLAASGHRGELRHLQRQLPTAPAGDPLAWDMVRLIQVAMGAASVGYLTPDEAYSLMLGAGRQLQQHYGSWTEFRTGFQTGRILWRMYGAHPSDNETKKSDASIDRTLHLLEHEPDSPWQKIPWDYLLSEPAPNDLYAALVSTASAENAAEEQPTRSEHTLN
ncbi:YbeU/YbeR family protein [Deinococcus radiomollis]|uniref:DUF1266 domain-containing protein n=1 Tax=Deinococcus radiomollis TaxID=468916 RepID=UPI003891793E